MNPFLEEIERQIGPMKPYEIDIAKHIGNVMTPPNLREMLEIARQHSFSVELVAGLEGCERDCTLCDTQAFVDFAMRYSSLKL